MKSESVKDIREFYTQVDFAALSRKKKRRGTLGSVAMIGSLAVICLIILVIFLDLLINGSGVLSWEFLTSTPQEGMTKGGIWPCIVGTFYVTVITTLFAIPFGIFTAIYLNEYAKDNLLTRIIRLAIRNLSGVPSIVYGIFGVALFVNAFGLQMSILSAGLTLGLLTIPWTITSSEEALKAVPVSFREGSLALGATKWYTIRKNVLPYAVPGIITGGILGLARAAGETAPILFTGAAYQLPTLPASLSDQFMALPYHIFSLATMHPQSEIVKPIAYGTSLVLIALVFLLSLFAIILRSRIRKKGIVNY